MGFLNLTQAKNKVHRVSQQFQMLHTSPDQVADPNGINTHTWTPITNR